MSLYTRLLNTDPQIPYDPYLAACREQLRGRISASDLAEYFSLNGSEQSEHADVITRMGALLLPLTYDEMRDSLNLAESELKYTTEATLKARWGID